MEERKPLVSVIVPVYNVYPYLRDCVQSVQAQSYQNWELLLVDDGSTDGSGELCDELAVEDGRIRVFHKPNGGLSDARNHGMHHARGEYFCFLDSDDLLPENALEKLVGLCEQHRADVAMGQLLQFETEPSGRPERPVEQRYSRCRMPSVGCFCEKGKSATRHVRNCFAGSCGRSCVSQRGCSMRITL